MFPRNTKIESLNFFPQTSSFHKYLFFFIQYAFLFPGKRYIHELSHAERYQSYTYIQKTVLRNFHGIIIVFFFHNHNTHNKPSNFNKWHSYKKNKRASLILKTLSDYKVRSLACAIEGGGKIVAGWPHSSGVRERLILSRKEVQVRVEWYYKPDFQTNSPLRRITITYIKRIL